MKTTVLFLLFFTFALGSFAQHNFSLKPMPKIDFNSGKLAADSANISFKFNQQSFDLNQYFSEKKQTTTAWYKQEYHSNMPIARPGNCQVNMPIAVPDSTINYAIRIKQISIQKDYSYLKKE